jgi:ADP-ribosyl-[dinitrogen reductase] hydrolase
MSEALLTPTLTVPNIRERLRGALLGTLVGDALGVPVEFSGRSKRDLDPVTGMRGFGTWKQPAGTWSDDGSMTLACAAMLVDHGWDLGQMMEGFRRWFDEAWWTAHGEVFDIGATTRSAIVSFRIHGDWQDCARDDEHSNGNGALMRIMPVSLWLIGGSAEERIAGAGTASALTHAHLRSRLCCAWHALWTEAAMAERDVRAAAGRASQRLRREVPAAERVHLARILDGSAMDQERAVVHSDGYVVSTLEAALWCLANHTTFADAVLAAVNLGGDTDTTAAVTGGMAGWLYGAQSIPAQWLATLPRQADVMDLTDRFAERCLDHWSAHGPG